MIVTMMALFVILIVLTICIHMIIVIAMSMMLIMTAIIMMRCWIDDVGECRGQVRGVMGLSWS